MSDDVRERMGPAAGPSGPPRCTLCGKPVRVRQSTPRKKDDDGRLRWFCKRCWYVRLPRLPRRPA